MPTPRLAAVVAAVLLAAGAMPAQHVWVVAPTPAAGVDFTDVESAVDAAVDGDVVLVRPGTYDAFRIQAKGLSVVADGAVVTLAAPSTGLEIEDVGGHQSVVVRGFALSTSGFSPLSISRCAGPVMVEDCTFDNSLPLAPGNGASVVSCTAVTLVRCRLIGGGTARQLTSGLTVLGSTVALHECTVQGGSAVIGSLQSTGADGVVLQRSAMSALATTFAGGRGRPGTALGGIVCIDPPGFGGDAVDLRDAASTAHLLGCVLLPGAGGTTQSVCPPSNPGQPVAGFGTSVSAAGPVGSLRVASPVRAGTSATLDLTGPAGSTVWLAVGPVQRPLFFAGCHGMLVPDLATSAFSFFGAMPAGGARSLQVPVPASLPVAGLPLFLQMGLADPTTATCSFGTATALVVVAARF